MMTISTIKNQLKSLEKLEFQLPDGTLVPEHFHVTEIGVIQKHFIDCGGTIRKEQKANFQLWSAGDFDHRLAPKKLYDIIALSEDKLGMDDLEIEVEYQGETIGKFGLDFFDGKFQLTTMQTDCLAKDACGIPAEKPKMKLSQLQDTTSCAPGSGCC